MNDEDDDPNAPIDFRSFGCGDPHCHIQALEGAIKGALPYFEKAAICYASSPANAKSDAVEVFQVIANLKELIHE